MTIKESLPSDPEARKAIPMATGLLDYFPAALAAVAEVSKLGNDQHNPGEPLHWARGKSMDHADCILRHLVDRGTVDQDGARHSAKLAWRALALLQEELEAAGAPWGRGSQQAPVDAPKAHLISLGGQELEFETGFPCYCGKVTVGASDDASPMTLLGLHDHS